MRYGLFLHQRMRQDVNRCFGLALSPQIRMASASRSEDKNTVRGVQINHHWHSSLEHVYWWHSSTSDVVARVYSKRKKKKLQENDPWTVLIRHLRNVIAYVVWFLDTVRSTALHCILLELKFPRTSIERDNARAVTMRLVTLSAIAVLTIFLTNSHAVLAQDD